MPHLNTFLSLSLVLVSDRSEIGNFRAEKDQGIIVELLKDIVNSLMALVG